MLHIFDKVAIDERLIHNSDAIFQKLVSLGHHILADKFKANIPRSFKGQQKRND